MGAICVYGRGMEHHQQHRHQHQQGHQHGGHAHDHVPDETPLAEMLDLDAEVMGSHLAEVTSWIADAAGDRPPRRIVDLGSGTGTGTFALLRRFGGADAVAVDASEQMLDHLRGRARELGVAERIRTVQADLDTGRPALEPADLVWASSSMHHMADPGRVLADIYATLAPGGLLAMVEMEDVPWFLPDDLGSGRPGLEERCHAALAEVRAAGVPHIGADWNTLLTGAGFAVQAERSFAIDLHAPLPPLAGRYAQSTLRRIRQALGEQLSSEDRATLDALVADEGPDSVLHRGDLRLRSTREAWIARRT